MSEKPSQSNIGKKYRNTKDDSLGDSLKFCMVTFNKMPWMGCWRFCRSVL